jgi:post-segregation antitoxin (ccd killing protein)
MGELVDVFVGRYAAQRATVVSRGDLEGLLTPEDARLRCEVWRECTIFSYLDDPEGHLIIGGYFAAPSPCQRRKLRLTEALEYDAQLRQGRRTCHRAPPPPRTSAEPRAAAPTTQLPDRPGCVCILCVVTRLNVYLPDELAAAAKKAGLNLSAVTQEAVRRTLAEGSTDTWLATVSTASSSEQVPHERALDALDAARDEAPTRHG